MTDSAFDRWATNVANPPRCPVCATLLDSGQRYGEPHIRTCPLCGPIKCDALRCESLVGPDGCACDPARPFCAACLTNCPTCRAAIEADYSERATR